MHIWKVKFWASNITIFIFIACFGYIVYGQDLTHTRKFVYFFLFLHSEEMGNEIQVSSNSFKVYINKKYNYTSVDQNINDVKKIILPWYIDL